MHDDDPIKAEEIRESALAWAVRTGDPAFAEWEHFTAWLEANPAHAAAYDGIVLAVDDAADALAAVPVANDDETAPAPWWRKWPGGAVAAALAAVLFFNLWSGPDGVRLIETVPGETRLVELDDGSTITLAGGTTVELTGPRAARLEQGQALFNVVHDDSAPFVVMAGDDRLVDLGTVFDVKLGRGGIALGVSEGVVVFNPQGRNVRVNAGELLVRRAGSDDVEVTSVDLAQVGEWTEGRLTFDMASLDLVAEDLSRSTGIAFAAVPVGAGYTVSGSLLTAPVKEDPRVLEDLLDVEVRQVGELWEIAER